MKIRKEKNFMSFFDEKTGKYLRTGIVKEGKDTGVDPFMASFPELLDVGIMGHCIHGQTGLCMKAGIECYQGGVNKKNDNMTLEDFENIAKQCQGRTYQFALGGCGDPEQHEHFREILEICRLAGIVPNFTSSGYGMTKDIAKLCGQYCGAVAISWYRSKYTLEAIEMLVNAGVKTNIHYVLSKNTVEEAVERVKTHSFPNGINALIFLLHKPVGLGRTENIISTSNKKFQELISLVSSGNMGYKIGFDSCTVPALINNPGIISLNSLDTCEGARWSAYISSDMKMMPCSFDNQDMRWAVDLRKFTIEEAWNSSEFEKFRTHFKISCPECGERTLCMGGCPIRPEIVLCDRKELFVRTVYAVK
ncbi:MAG: SPASM domain-containing protein [Eubacterium sp.]|nr:SPASM domain-containing protein [Eubacterium sp.]